MGSWVTAVWRKANPRFVVVSLGVMGIVLALACSGAGGEKGSVEGDRAALTALYDAGLATGLLGNGIGSAPMTQAALPC